MSPKLQSRPNNMLFVFSAKFEIMENCDVVFYNVSSGLAAMDQLRDIIDPSLNDKPEVTFKEIPILAEAFERYRWPTTMALQGNINIICLLIFVLGNYAFLTCLIITLYSIFRHFRHLLPPFVHWCNRALQVHFDHVQCIWTLLNYFLVADCISLPDGCSCIRRLLY